MRLIIYGVGAVGGTVAAAMALSGQDVIGVARGARLEAIRARGLRLLTPGGERRARFDCVAGPEEIGFRDGDMVMLATKTQDTPEALARLRAAGWRDGPVFCAQNGVANERMALRRFPNTHGVLVMMPASFSKPDEAVAYSTPRHGVFEIGRYPDGADADDARLAAAMEAANIGGFAVRDVMAAKYGKLLLNLGNIVEAALGPGAEAGEIRAAVRREAEAMLAAAGIAWRDVGAADPRRDALMRQAEVAGARRMGGSTTQSLARGAGSVETDYLNGEIALLARLHGREAPANARLCEIAARLAREGAPPGALTAADLAAELRKVGASL